MNTNYGYEYKEKYQYLTNICLNLTDACNLRCKYCFVKQKPHYMELDTAKDIVDWLVQNLNYKKEKKYVSENTKCSLNFFGGEPMLLYDKVIVPLVEYVESTYPDLFTFGITTNGTLLDNDKIYWLKQHNIGILLSIDGNKTTQDINRPHADKNISSFDLIQKNIPYLLKLYPNITFRSTIDESTVKYVFENYIFAEQSGFKNIFLIPNGRNSWQPENLQILDQEMEKIFDYRKTQYLNGKPVLGASFIDRSFGYLKTNMKIYLNNAKNINRDQIHRVERCGLGTNSGSVGYNGDIYGCQEQDSYGNEKSIFYIGNIYNGGINQELHDKLLRKYAYQGRCKSSNLELCYKCYLQNSCYEYNCPSSSNDCFSDFAIMPDVHCIWQNILYNYAMTTTYFLMAQQNQMFIKYFNNIK